MHRVRPWRSYKYHLCEERTTLNWHFKTFLLKCHIWSQDQLIWLSIFYHSYWLSVCMTIGKANQCFIDPALSLSWPLMALLLTAHRHCQCVTAVECSHPTSCVHHPSVHTHQGSSPLCLNRFCPLLPPWRWTITCSIWGMDRKNHLTKLKASYTTHGKWNSSSLKSSFPS